LIPRAGVPAARLDVDTVTLALAPGDLYLICSDGLTDIVRDREIADVLTSNRDDLDAAAEGLVAAANHGGGIDNITVVLFEIIEGDPAPRQEPDEHSEPEPDADTAEQALPLPSPADATSGLVQRHGAKAGGRWLALAAILIGLAAALLVIWWSLGR
jgi:protein phosphatase